MISKIAKDLLDKSLSNKFEGHDLHLVSDSFLGADLYFNLDEKTNITNWRIDIGNQKLDEERISLLCGVLELVSRLGIRHIFKVTFREVESFVRDENHLPAWENVTASRKWLNDAISTMVSSFGSALLLKQGVNLVEWNDLNLEQRIQNVSDILERVSPCFELLLSDNIELVSIEEDQILLSVGPSLLESKHFEVFMTTLLEYFQFSLCSTEIKLVAQ